MNVVLLGSNTKEEIENNLRIVASAGALSRSEGTVMDVYESKNDYQKNLRLAKAVVGYGHRSISEHDYLVFALEDVTPVIEQTIIEYRLTSFTIKSRRNVDFRNVGFYVPDFKTVKGDRLDSRELNLDYNNYMKSLFTKYGELIDEGLPIEDCRYILPYSYHSNIIMGCDANELFRITSDLLYGKMSKIDEAKELGAKLANMMEEACPYLVSSLKKEEKKDYYNDQFTYLDKLVKQEDKLLTKPKLTDYLERADDKVLCSILMNRYQLSSEQASKVLDELVKEDKDIKKKMFTSLLHSKNQRELEQVMYSFELPISLAVLTHISRHRMQSLLVPDFVPLWNMENYVIPDSIKDNHEEEYKDIFKKNNLKVEEYKDKGIRDEDLVYFYLSGNACNITTTMNARNFEWITRMRCCNKAQWEIRELMTDLKDQVKEVNPLIGTMLGANCEVNNYCPEGKDSCKNRGVVVKQKIK